MKKLFLLYTFLFVSLFVLAHPGIGIVKDSKGNIFYTDLKQVWKITPDGNKQVVVSGVHTHELYIDPQDNLFGEHLWYNGESKDTWGHYVWQLKNSGELVKEIDPTDGFLTNYSFTRDSLGNMYWVERFTSSRIMKKTRAGEITKLIEGKFGFIGWIYSTKEGVIYFTESNKLHRLTQEGKLETLAESIGSKTTDFTIMGRNYNSYGIWTDKADNIYMAMLDSKKVIRIGTDGKPQTVIATNSVWTICSGIFDDSNNMWVLENSATNEVRVRKFNKEEISGEAINADTTNSTHLAITFATAVAIIILFFLVRIILIRKAHTNHFKLV